MILRALGAHDWPGVDRLISCVPAADTKGIVAVSPAGEILGAVILDNWTMNAVTGHVGASSPMVWRKGLHTEVFDYVFNMTGRKIIYANIAAFNTKALNFVKRIGFVEIFRLKDGHAEGIDLVITELRAENCPQYKEEEVYGSENSSTTRAAGRTPAGHRAVPAANAPDGSGARRAAAGSTTRDADAASSEWPAWDAYSSRWGDARWADAAAAWDASRWDDFLWTDAAAAWDATAWDAAWWTDDRSWWTSAVA